MALRGTLTVIFPREPQPSVRDFRQNVQHGRPLSNRTHPAGSIGDPADLDEDTTRQIRLATLVERLYVNRRRKRVLGKPRQKTLLRPRGVQRTSAANRLRPLADVQLRPDRARFSPWHVGTCFPWVA
jgi:hypothetical protein